MATYKLIQNIEADDKLLGPLSFKQFVYSLAAILMLYISYLLLTHHAGFLDIVTMPVALFAGFLAFPFGKDQPTEVWAIAKLRFFLKPRRRIWAQSGVKELVTITVPKKIDIQKTDGLSQTQVKSRLQALASTIDSHGWAIKNLGAAYQTPLANNDDSDRLISTSILPKEVPEYDVPDSEDLFNDSANPIAQQVNRMLTADSGLRRQELIEHLNETRAEVANKQAKSQTVSTLKQPTATAISASEDEIEEELKDAYQSSHAPLSNMHALRSKVVQTHNKTAATVAPKQPSTAQSDPVIINLSKRNDLNVSVISNEADRAKPNDSGTVEVLIPH